MHYKAPEHTLCPVNPPNSGSQLKTFLYTSIALIAFAGNSILCRLALGAEAIDAADFTSVRLVSGAVFLLILLKFVQPSVNGKSASRGSWKAAFMLFIYAISFSYAYISLDTGTGALILFTAVQISMIVFELLGGKKLLAKEWLGVGIAFSGFVYLMTPGATAPSIIGFLLMSVSGVAWGAYSLAGKGSVNPMQDTSYNFLRTLPLVLLLIGISRPFEGLSLTGIWLAILSGAIASGAGYAIWYMALRGLSGIQAAVIQLFVPVLATFGGILFANESLSVRLFISSLLILGGIFLLVWAKFTTARSEV